MTGNSLGRGVAGQPSMTTRPWVAGLTWLLFLGVFFFSTYNGANWLASQRAHVPSLVFDWERSLPFVPWTIIPYWSIDAFYALSLLTCRTREEVGTLGRRLLTAQVVAVTFFVLTPLRFSFTQPAAEGVHGAMFAALAAFDKPFNQAPSLHIALLIVLWVHFAPRLAAPLRALFHVWCVLIAVSVLTTYQHHFFDLPAGAALGFFCWWLWPADRTRSPLREARLNRDPAAQRLALRYAMGALACLAAALLLGGTAWWLLWGCISLGLVSAAYAVLGPAAFQKDAQGRLSPAAIVLLAPYLLAARLNVWLWTRRHAGAVPIADGVWMGRYPSRQMLRSLPVVHVVDLSAEMTGVAAWQDRITFEAHPCLDLISPSPAMVSQAVQRMETLRASGPVLVCCALGYSRSAATVAVWLVRTGRCRDAAQAIAQIRQHRPRIVLDTASIEALLVDLSMPAKGKPVTPPQSLKSIDSRNGSAGETA